MPKTTRRELSNAEKGAILVLFHLQYTIALIGYIIGRPWSTVKSFIVRATERGSIENLPRPGRPEKLSKYDRRAIMRAVKKDRSLTRQQLRDLCAPHVSLSTIDRYLRQNGFKKWLAKKRPKLTEDHANNVLLGQKNAKIGLLRTLRE